MNPLVPRLVTVGLGTLATQQGGAGALDDALQDPGNCGRRGFGLLLESMCSKPTLAYDLPRAHHHWTILRIFMGLLLAPLSSGYMFDGKVRCESSAAPCIFA